MRKAWALWQLCLKYQSLHYKKIYDWAKNMLWWKHFQPNVNATTLKTIFSRINHKFALKAKPPSAVLKLHFLLHVITRIPLPFRIFCTKCHSWLKLHYRMAVWQQRYYQRQIIYLFYSEEKGHRYSNSLLLSLASRPFLHSRLVSTIDHVGLSSCDCPRTWHGARLGCENFPSNSNKKYKLTFL